MSTIKKRQHFVWQNYLNEWSTNSIIACLKNNQVFKTNTENIAVEKYFYKHVQLSKDDIKFIRLFFRDRADHVKNYVEKELEFYSSPDNFKRILKAFNITNAESQEFIKEMEINFHEDYMTKVESFAIPILKMLKNGKRELSKEELTEFSYFVATQWVRTKAIRTRIEKVLIGTEIFNINKVAVTRFMNSVFAFNIGFTLFRDYKLHLMINNTELEFITGDLPVVNLKAKYDESLEPPKEMVLYYPISRKKALIYDLKDKTIENEIFDIERIKYLNNFIVKASNEMVFASNEELLKNYIES